MTHDRMTIDIYNTIIGSNPRENSSSSSPSSLIFIHRYVQQLAVGGSTLDYIRYDQRLRSVGVIMAMDARKALFADDANAKAVHR